MRQDRSILDLSSRLSEGARGGGFGQFTYTAHTTSVAKLQVKNAAQNRIHYTPLRKALARPVTVRAADAVPLTIAAVIRWDRKASGASRSAPFLPPTVPPNSQAAIALTMPALTERSSAPIWCLTADPSSPVMPRHVHRAICGQPGASRSMRNRFRILTNTAEARPLKCFQSPVT